MSDELEMTKAEEIERDRMAAIEEARAKRAASAVRVKRTKAGPHPLTACERVWNAGDVGEMPGREADPRIEQGLFEETDEPMPE